MQYRSIAAIRSHITQGNTTLHDVVCAYLEQIESRNDELNVFLEVYADEAKTAAKVIQDKILAGTAGALAGAVIGIKDVLAYKDHSLQGGSYILDKFKSQFTATAIQRLIDADAIIIGRQNCDEFAMGSTNENPYYGPTKNGLDPSLVPGGSSGASAVAVQTGMCIASIGSDTGGSVRQPAAFCGVVGFKPSYSRVSRYGLVAYASSFDSIGTLTNTIENAALLVEVMAGKDLRDSTSSSLDVPAYSKSLESPSFKKKVAVLAPSFNEAINVDIRNAFQGQIDSLKEQGFTVETVEFPLLDYILPTYYILTTAEASSNLSRFDGVRYGHRSADATDLESMYKLSRSEGFGIEVKRRIMLGTFVLSANYYDAYFTKAQRVRRLIKDATDAILKEYDFIITPTTPTTAYKIGAVDGDPIAMYLGDVFTVQANVAGICGCSIPIGFDSKKLPIGMQIMAGAFEEEKLMQFAHWAEKNISQTVTV
jgi:aspartyl-tRNA(Asn)/glutamyl-tRNA(Gln) amidotransferase subunit A